MRPLEMRVAGKDGVLLALREIEEGPHHPLQLGLAGDELPRGPQPQVGGDLIVAASAGVQLLAELTDAGDELALDPTVDVLVARGGDRRGILQHRREDVLQSRHHRATLVGGENASPFERLRPRHRALDVLTHQCAVEHERIVEAAKEIVGLAFGPACPQRGAGGGGSGRAGSLGH